MGILVVRLKAIKYKEDSSCYLFSYPMHQIVPLGRMSPSRTLFATRPYHQAICHQVAPSDPSLHLAPNFYPNILVLHHQKSRIPDPSEKPNKASFSLSPLPITSDGKYPRAISNATNFSHKRVKQTPKSLALLRPVCRVAWSHYGGS